MAVMICLLMALNLLMLMLNCVSPLSWIINASAQQLIKAFCSGDGYACAVIETKGVKCWGRKYSFGSSLSLDDLLSDNPKELGDGIPYLNISSTSAVRDVSCGGQHVCVLLDSNDVKCLGNSRFGQTALGFLNKKNPLVGQATGYIGDSLPKVDLGSSFPVLSFVLGANHSCFLSNQKRLKCYGNNNYGQLGLGNKNQKGAKKDDMGDNLAPIAFGSNIQIESVHSSSTANHNCVIVTDVGGSPGQLKCWGFNRYTQLGYSSAMRGDRGDEAGEMGVKLPFVDLGVDMKVQRVALGAAHTCALLTNSILKCWGTGFYGKPGPGKISTIKAIISSAGNSMSSVLIDAGSTIKFLSTGFSHTCIVYGNQLTMKCIGNDTYGLLGQGDFSQKGNSSLTFPLIPAIQLGTGSLNITSIHSGAHFICVIFENNKFKCFGDNSNAQLAIGSTKNVGYRSYEMGENLTYSKIFSPTTSPTSLPTKKPSINPSNSPSRVPTSEKPSISKTTAPIQLPTTKPTSKPPTKLPTAHPSLHPSTKKPTVLPTSTPTLSKSPTARSFTDTPTIKMPTLKPTSNPSTEQPSPIPTSSSPTSLSPTNSVPTSASPSTSNSTFLSPTTRVPTKIPTTTSSPTVAPSKIDPTSNPSTINPTLDPTTRIPSKAPQTNGPVTDAPTPIKTESPSGTRNGTTPSLIPTKLPAYSSTASPVTVTPRNPPTRIPTITSPTNQNTTNLIPQSQALAIGLGVSIPLIAIIFGVCIFAWRSHQRRNLFVRENEDELKRLCAEYQNVVKIAQPTPQIFDAFMKTPIMQFENELIQMIAKLLQRYRMTDDKFEKIKIRKLLKCKEMSELAINVYDVIYHQAKEYFNMSENYYGKWHVFLSHGGMEKEGIVGWSSYTFDRSSILNIFLDEKVLKLGNFAMDAMVFSALTCDYGFCFMTEDYLFYGKKWTLREYYLLQSRYKYEKTFQNIPIFYHSDKSKLKTWVDEVVSAPLPGIEETQTGLIFQQRFESENMDTVAKYVFEKMLGKYPDIPKPELLEGDPNNLVKLGLIIPFIKQKQRIICNSNGTNRLSEEEENGLIKQLKDKLMEENGEHGVVIKCSENIEPAYLSALLMNTSTNTHEASKWGWKWWIDCTNKEKMEGSLSSLCDELKIPKKIEQSKRVEYLTNFMRGYDKSIPYFVLFSGLTNETIEAQLFDFSICPPNGCKILVVSNDNIIESKFGRTGFDYDVHEITINAAKKRTKNKVVTIRTVSCSSLNASFRASVSETLENLTRELESVDVDNFRFKYLCDQYGLYLLRHLLDLINRYFEGKVTIWAKEFAANPTSTPAADANDIKEHLLSLVYKFINDINKIQGNQKQFEDVFDGTEIDSILDICFDMDKRHNLLKTLEKMIDVNGTPYPPGMMWIAKSDWEKLLEVYKENEFALDIIQKNNYTIDDAFSILFEKTMLFGQKYSEYMRPEAPQWMMVRIPNLQEELENLIQKWKFDKREMISNQDDSGAREEKSEMKSSNADTNTKEAELDKNNWKQLSDEEQRDIASQQLQKAMNGMSDLDRKRRVDVGNEIKTKKVAVSPLKR